MWNSRTLRRAFEKFTHSDFNLPILQLLGIIQRSSPGAGALRRRYATLPKSPHDIFAAHSFASLDTTKPAGPFSVSKRNRRSCVKIICKRIRRPLRPAMSSPAREQTAPPGKTSRTFPRGWQIAISGTRAVPKISANCPRKSRQNGGTAAAAHKLRPWYDIKFTPKRLTLQSISYTLSCKNATILFLFCTIHPQSRPCIFEKVLVKWGTGLCIIWK